MENFNTGKQPKLEVVLVEGENRMDSRLVAKSLGIDPSNFLELLRKYQAELEEIGILPFQTGEIKGRGQPEKYVMLNEDQTVFAVTLSKNTPEVVRAKLNITIAFSKARKGFLINFKDLHGIVTIVHNIDSALTERDVLLNETKALLAHAVADKGCKIFTNMRRDIESFLVRLHNKNRFEVRHDNSSKQLNLFD